MSQFYCNELGMSVADVFSDNPTYVHQLNNGSVLEIFSHGKSLNVEVENIVKCLCTICGNDTNIKACLSKIYRVQNNDKVRRGSARHNYRLMDFMIPAPLSQTASSVQPSESENQTEPLLCKNEEKLTKKLQERREHVRHLQEQNKQLSRKLERKESKTKAKELSAEKDRKAQSERANAAAQKLIRKSCFILQSMDKKLGTLKEECLGNKHQLRQRNTEINKIKRFIVEKDALAQAKADTFLILQSRCDSLLAEVKTLKEDNKVLKQDYRDLAIHAEYIESLVQDGGELHVYDSTSHTYTNDLVECAINLTNCKVATKNVGPVLREVAALCGKTFNAIPSRQTVDNFVDRKVALSQKQIADVASKSTNTTLYTDETRKHGHTYESYIVSDDNRSYMLGLREMANKSGSATLSTLQDILRDITDHCHQLEVQENYSIGYQLLSNNRNTMSDRAATEKKFNSLLHAYRESVLPEVTDHYDKLTEEQQELYANMNNFFCGLHLLVGMADVCESSLRKFETAYCGTDGIGSAACPELKRFHLAESGTMRLLRTGSKAFAMGEDEKNGVFLHWHTFLKSKCLKNHITRFKHNRFNMIFMIAGAVYYHSGDIQHFLEHVHGTGNSLLKAVLLDAKEVLYLAGCKALGLISKFITAPLWRLIEAPGHILDMNRHFKALIDFLDDVANKPDFAMQFMRGDVSVFENNDAENDKVLTMLLEQNDKIDEVAQPLLQNLATAMQQLLTRMVPEHLPGGKYWDPSEALKEQTQSAKKHNKMPEFVFGQLDHLISFRPNASILANEAYIMYAFNKTSQWLHGLPDSEKDGYLEESRKEGRVVRKKFKARIKQIQETRLEQQVQKQMELEKKEEARLKTAERMTNDVCFYGLWQSSGQIEEGMQRIGDNAKELESALKAQTNFRKNVLRQKHTNKKVFNFSEKQANGKYKKLSITKLKNNVLELVRTASNVDTTEVRSGDVPLLVGTVIKHTFADNTYRGNVISVVPGFPDWYNVQYQNDSAVYVYNLKADYARGDLHFLENQGDLAFAASIDHEQ